MILKLEFLFIFLILSTSVFGVSSMNFLTKGYADTLYCSLNSACTLASLTVDSLTVYNLSVIGDVFNVTMNLVTWNITESFNVGGNIEAKNITALDKFKGDGSLLTDLTHSLQDAYDDGSVIQVDDTDVVWDMSAGKIFNVTNNLFSNKKNISNLVRSATLVVCASNSKDKTNCDYVCDGIEDDVEIQDAIYQLTQGGKVFLLEGTYNLLNSIWIDDSNNIVLEGSGTGTILKNSFGTGGALVVISGVENIVVRNLQVDGSNETVSAGTSQLIYIRDSKHVLIENNYIHNTSGTTYRGVGVHQATVPSNNIRITNNRFENIGGAGIILTYNVERIIIDDNSMVDCSTGITMTVGATNCLIRGNTIKNSKSSSMHLTYIKDSLILNNIILDSGSNGIDLFEDGGITADSNIVQGNYIYNASLGISLEDGDYNLIGNNRVDNCSTGITVFAGENNVIYGNLLLGNTNAISDSGTGTVLFANTPGASSFGIQSKPDETIKILPEGNLTMILNPFNVTIFGNQTIGKDLFVTERIYLSANSYMEADANGNIDVW